MTGAYDPVITPSSSALKLAGEDTTAYRFRTRLGNRPQMSSILVEGVGSAHWRCVLIVVEKMALLWAICCPNSALPRYSKRFWHLLILYKCIILYLLSSSSLLILYVSHRQSKNLDLFFGIVEFSWSVCSTDRNVVRLVQLIFCRFPAGD